jgi:hypothetical protein
MMISRGKPEGIPTKPTSVPPCHPQISHEVTMTEPESPRRKNQRLATCRYDTTLRGAYTSVIISVFIQSV